MCKTQKESCQSIFCAQMLIWENEQQKHLENSQAIYFQ